VKPVDVHSKAKEGPYCPSDNCDSEQTCCTMDDGSPGCCPLPNATCCGVFDMCCAQNYTCDPVKNDCVLSQNTTYCYGCKLAVEQMISSGCGAVCSVLPPPADAICELINELGICEEIIEWTTQGLSPQSICTVIGLCSGGTCACGYCTRYVYGRCLSLPNHCPSSSSSSTSSSDHISVEQMKMSRQTEICIAGQCTESTEGCCLTCF